MAYNPAVTFFVDDAAVTAGEARVPNADFDTGMNFGGSNAPGVGINQGGGAVVGTPEQFTLLDQGRPGVGTPVAREAQISQCIGGPGISAAGTSAGATGADPEGVVRFGTPTTTGNGTVTPTGNSTLSVLATGWTIQA